MTNNAQGTITTTIRDAVTLVSILVMFSAAIGGCYSNKNCCPEAYQVQTKEVMEIYTTSDILYIQGNTVRSEMGIDTTFSNSLDRNEWLAQRTANESTITDAEIWNLIENYSSVEVIDNNYITLSLFNPYTDIEHLLHYNVIDELENGVFVHYFED